LTVARRVALGAVLGALALVAGSCLRAPQATAGDVTFTRDVAPILHEHCVVCHRPGESAPFPLVTYQDARKHDRQIAEVTASRFMPPWLPERGAIAFHGERGLTDAEIDVLRRWHAGGSPEGDAADLPPLPRWTTGWQLGEPDLVIEADAPYVVPAEGLDVFRNLVIPIPGERRRWIRAVELRPGNPRVVHHAVMRIDASRSSRLLDERDDGPGYEGMEWGEAQAPEGQFLGWTPGKAPWPGSDELAWALEPGSDFVVQLHLVPTGKPEEIRPRVGFHFAEGPPTRAVETVVLDVKLIDIPAGESRHVVEESYELPVAVEVISIYPHAHYLGRELLGWADLPDGSRRWLIRILDWDFNWQDQYRYVEPVRLPAGSKVALRYTYDNSADNPRNPARPPRRVTSGNRSTDEMGSLSLEVVLEETDRARLREALLRQDLARWPDYWVAHGLLGRLLLDRGEAREAVRHLQRAVQVHADYPVGHNNLGAALSRIGEDEAAMASFRRALALRPHYADAHYNLAVELAARGRLDEAVGHYRQALEVRELDPDVHNNLGVALAMLGRSAEATRHFKRALELSPDSPDARGNLGNMLMEQGRYFEAVEHYRVALAGRPDSADLRVNLGIAMQMLGEVEARIATLERSVRAGSADPNVYGELGELYAVLNRQDEAVARLGHAIELAQAAGSTDLAVALRARLQAIETRARN
jgi:Flp pilus assembly protein TadD